MSFPGKLQNRETWNNAEASCIVQVGNGDVLEWERVMEMVSHELILKIELRNLLRDWMWYEKREKKSRRFS